MTHQAKISVITPNFNHASLLPEMLDSTLSQSLPPHEIIIIDDGSTDNSIEVIQQYQAKHSCIKLIKNQKNEGVSISVNKGINAVTGDFCVFRSADDLNMPGLFEKSIQLLQKYPQAAMCCSDLFCFNDSPPHKFLREPSGFTPIREYYDKENVPICVGSNLIHAHTAVVRTDIVKKNKGYVDNLKWYADWFCMTAAAFRYGFCYIPEPLAAARISSGSYGNKTSSSESVQKELMRELLRRLQNQDKDLIPSFAKSGILEMFYPHIVNLYFEESEFWTPQVNLLLQSALYRWNIDHQYLHEKRGIETVILHRLLSKKDSIYSTKFRSGGKMAVYGAGGHTRSLLKVWKDLDLPEIELIVTTDRPPFSHFEGIPVLSIKELDKKQIAMLTISSKSYEDNMVQQANLSFPGVPVLTFWNERISSL